MAGAVPLVTKIETMRNPDSYYLAPRSDEQEVMKMWMKPKRIVNVSIYESLILVNNVFIDLLPAVFLEWCSP